MIRHFSPYDQVADEYYDPDRHPTCANFRQLAHLFISDLRRDFIFEEKLRNGRVLETGAAFSLAAEIMSRDFGNLSNLTIQDASEAMLAHSVRWQNSLKEIYVSDARQLRAGDASYDIIFSILADPYNDARLWTEISRVLAEGGYWVLTTPSHHWAKKFRSGSDLKSSRFVIAYQEEVDLPSFTYPVPQVIRGVENAGQFFRRYKCLTIGDIEGQVSEKLYAKGAGGSVLDCFLFQK